MSEDNKTSAQRSAQQVDAIDAAHDAQRNGAPNERTAAIQNVQALHAAEALTADAAQRARNVGDYSEVEMQNGQSVLRKLTAHERALVTAQTDTSVLGAEIEARFMQMDRKAGRSVPLSRTAIAVRQGSLARYAALHAPKPRVYITEARAYAYQAWARSLPSYSG